MKTKVALITGIGGQDGSYLAELLLSKGYEVHGIARRRASSDSLPNIEPIVHRLNMHWGSVNASSFMLDTLCEVQPDEIYNLAAQSHVGHSWVMPAVTIQTNCLTLLPILSWLRRSRARLYQASSSEMFGNNLATRLDEDIPLAPCSPYGVSKAAAHTLCHTYRDAYDLFVTCGICFNHESPRRASDFVTRKIIRAAKQRSSLKLGDNAPVRDWGYAPEYVEAMWLMLQQNKPSDYVIGSGVGHNVAEFTNAAYAMAGLRAEQYVTYGHCTRSNEIERLVANPWKATHLLNWTSNLQFVGLVALMFEEEKV